MAFKTIDKYNEERFGNLFLLRDDGDYADVIFLYQSPSDALVADTHYIKSSDYSGYVHCCGRGCPACGKGIRVQTKLFIPLYNINSQEIQFWDRTMRFEPQLKHDVFANYPDPSGYVFRITRKGAAGDINTTYSIIAIGKNTYKSYEEILKENNVSFPDYYENICKDVPQDKLYNMLNSSGETTTDMPEYKVTPRVPTASYIAPPSTDSVPLPVDSEIPDGDDSDDEVVF